MSRPVAVGQTPRPKAVVAQGRRIEGALEYARSYRGNSEFMTRMRYKASRTGWIPSDRQVDAILAFAARELHQ